MSWARRSLVRASGCLGRETDLQPDLPRQAQRVAVHPDPAAWLGAGTHPHSSSGACLLPDHDVRPDRPALRCPVPAPDRSACHAPDPPWPDSDPAPETTTASRPGPPAPLGGARVEHPLPAATCRPTSSTICAGSLFLKNITIIINFLSTRCIGSKIVVSSRPSRRIPDRVILRGYQRQEPRGDVVADRAWVVCSQAPQERDPSGPAGRSRKREHRSI